MPQVKTYFARESDRPWIDEVMVKSWGAEFVIVKGRKIRPSLFEAVIAADTAETKLGLLTFTVSDGNCEILTINAFATLAGTGSAMLELLLNEMTVRGIKRLSVTTSNDNLDGIRFYQKRGFTMCAFYRDSMKQARKIKPTIPEIGEFGIKADHELEFELNLP